MVDVRAMAGPTADEGGVVVVVTDDKALPAGAPVVEGTRPDPIAAARRSADQRRGLITIAHALGDAETEDDVLEVVTAQGVRLLGATGGGMTLLEPDGRHARAVTSAVYSAESRAAIAHVPLTFPIPPVHTAATGQALFLSDQARTLELFPGARSIYTAEGIEASTAVPLRARGRLLGCLSLAFDVVHDWPDDEQDLMEAFATLTAQALDRISAREAEQVASRAVARFSETLQRSLLSAPPQPTDLEIAVRYLPAAAVAQVGGDWYDAFVTSDGSTHLVIGDVTGHDQQAAATMAQLRNLLRGIASTLRGPLSKVLGALDRTVVDLRVDALASVVLARLEPWTDGAADGGRVLHWSNAGHPPPLLVTADGTTRFLDDADPDLLLGFDPGADRLDHSVVLEPGGTVIFFTDGLVERRSASLQTGLDWLSDTVADLARLGVSDLCEALLGLVGDQVEDDVALLVVRARPGTATSSAEQGGGELRAWATGRPGRGSVPRGLVLEPAPAAVRRARGFVVQLCREHHVPDDTCDTVELLTSEVVTNAFLHGRSRTRLEISVSDPPGSGPRVRVEVGDENSTRPTLVADDPGALNGRGIALVAQLANDWGVREEASGKTVWFELVSALPMAG